MATMPIAMSITRPVIAPRLERKRRVTTPAARLETLRRGDQLDKVRVVARFALGTRKAAVVGRQAHPSLTFGLRYAYSTSTNRLMTTKVNAITSTTPWITGMSLAWIPE